MHKMKTMTMHKMKDMGAHEFERVWNQLMSGKCLYKTMDKRILDFKNGTVITPSYPKVEKNIKDIKDAICKQAQSE